MLAKIETGRSNVTPHTTKIIFRTTKTNIKILYGNHIYIVM